MCGTHQGQSNSASILMLAVGRRREEICMRCKDREWPFFKNSPKTSSTQVVLMPRLFKILTTPSCCKPGLSPAMKVPQRSSLGTHTGLRRCSQFFLPASSSPWLCQAQCLTLETAVLVSLCLYKEWKEQHSSLGLLQAS